MQNDGDQKSDWPKELTPEDARKADSIMADVKERLDTSVAEAQEQEAARRSVEELPPSRHERRAKMRQEIGRAERRVVTMQDLQLAMMAELKRRPKKAPSMKAIARRLNLNPKSFNAAAIRCRRETLLALGSTMVNGAYRAPDPQDDKSTAIEPGPSS